MRIAQRVGGRFPWRLEIVLEPRDAWVGLFWSIDRSRLLHLYLCVVPFVPVHLTIGRQADVSAAMLRTVAQLAPSRQARRSLMRAFRKGQP
jgi:hypothetical protein